MSSIKPLVRKHLPKWLDEVLRGRTEGVRFLFGGSLPERLRILGQYETISRHVECTQSEAETLLAARMLLGLASSVPGAIVECGCYKGGSTTKFSLIAQRLNRPLIVFDSFQGLPSEQQPPAYYNFIDAAPIEFQTGAYQAGLDTVKHNVDAYGSGETVHYVPGFFEDSMPDWRGSVAAIILDVDLLESTKTVLNYLWPQLSKGGLVFSQDAHLQPIVDLFQDSAYWRTLCESQPPQFVGLGRQKMVYARKSSTP